jgi:hypothetical protein
MTAVLFAILFFLLGSVAQTLLEEVIKPHIPALISRIRSWFQINWPGLVLLALVGWFVWACFIDNPSTPIPPSTFFVSPGSYSSQQALQ